MAVETPCQTPDAVYRTVIEGNTVAVVVKLPFDLHLGEEQAKLLEDNLHNVLELVLSKYFRRLNG